MLVINIVNVYECDTKRMKYDAESDERVEVVLILRCGNSEDGGGTSELEIVFSSIRY